jgi:threonine dehydratase
MKLLFTATHNVAEGAGAAAMAAAMQLKDELKGLKVGLPLCGGNVDAKQFSIIIGAWNFIHEESNISEQQFSFSGQRFV